MVVCYLPFLRLIIIAFQLVDKWCVGGIFRLKSLIELKERKMQQQLKYSRRVGCFEEAKRQADGICRYID
jgi:hypothetical protein